MNPKLIPHNQPYLDRRDQAAVQRVLASGWIAEGLVTRDFEKKMAAALGRKYSKATSSGTSALHLALLALGVGKSDEVIVSTYACTALLNAIAYVGATPKVADISEDNLGMSFASAKKLVSKKTRALMVHHAFGYPADILSLKKLGIPIIEDCAQALGSEIGGKPAGGFGDITVLSFYATKMMTTGYGGMLLTDNPRWTKIVRDLTDYDRRRDYKIRFNYSISDMAAALGLSQLAKLPGFLKRRGQIAASYIKALQGSDYYWWEGRPGEKPNFYRFMIGGLKPYSSYQKQFARQRIQVISPLAPYQLLHRYLGMSPKRFPVSEAISRSIVSLPIYPALKQSDAARICRALAMQA